MTATTFSRLPLLAGSAVATSLGRVGLWTLARYMRAPAASTGLLAMVTLTALAASNALYFQTTRHPAPFFAPHMDAATAVVDPVAVPEPVAAPTTLRQTAVLPPVGSGDTTGSVNAAPQAMPAPVIPDGPVGNRDAFAVQKKLTELGLFTGIVDGFYGPRTATAIRAFETRNGLEPTGALTPDVIDAILRSDSVGRIPVAEAVVAPPAPIVVPVVAPQPQADVVVARVATLSPVDEAVDTVGNAAAQTIDTIVAAVDGGRGTPEPVANAPVPSRPLLAAPARIETAPVQVASLEPMAAPRPVTAIQAEPVPQAMLATAAVAPANNVQLVSQIQSGLASLGFYHGSIDGHPGDTTARAIREFENFYSYKVTGQINPDLVSLLRQAGATI